MINWIIAHPYFWGKKLWKLVGSLGENDGKHAWIFSGEWTVIACKLRTMWYHAVPHQTVHFWFEIKLKSHGIISTLHTFKFSALGYCNNVLDWGSLQRQNTIAFLFALNHTHCHLSTWSPKCHYLTTRSRACAVLFTREWTCMLARV